MADEFAVMAGQIPADAPDLPAGDEHTRHAFIKAEGLEACARCGVEKRAWLADPVGCDTYMRAEREGT